MPLEKTTLVNGCPLLKNKVERTGSDDFVNISTLSMVEDNILHALFTSGKRISIMIQFKITAEVFSVLFPQAPNFICRNNEEIIIITTKDPIIFLTEGNTFSSAVVSNFKILFTLL